jgi:hypothetical protein
MTLLTVADLTLDDLDSIQDSPVAQELAYEQEASCFLFNNSAGF